MNERIDVAIVGGGIGGLACARALAQAGLTVRVFERRARPGGRATCATVDGFHLDQGPHALYRNGGGMAVLRGLGVEPRGSQPPVTGRCLLDDGDAVLPASPMGIMRFSAIPFAARLALAKALVGVGRLDPSAWDTRTVADWLSGYRPEVAHALAMFVRLVTYCHAPAVQSAGAAIRALQAGTDGVLYLDGGWQSLIDDLAADLDLRHARVDAIEGTLGARRVVTDAGTVVAGAVVVAAGPAVARRLIGSDWHGQPIRAACLTLALERPPPVRFALGYTAPVYFSVPSQTASQAPDGCSVVHVARYLAPDERPPSVDSLEGVLDRLDPAWRTAERHRRFLPRITVSHHLPTAATGGPAGRAPVQVAADLFQVGDWVGPDGQLVDASLCSARAVADAIIARRVARAA